MEFGKFQIEMWDKLTLSSQQLAVKVDDEKKAGYREKQMHLIEIPKCIVKKKSQGKVRYFDMPLHGSR